jgi:hypothetical protein
MKRVLKLEVLLLASLWSKLVYFLMEDLHKAGIDQESVWRSMTYVVNELPWRVPRSARSALFIDLCLHCVVHPFRFRTK